MTKREILAAMLKIDDLTVKRDAGGQDPFILFKHLLITLQLDLEAESECNQAASEPERPSELDLVREMARKELDASMYERDKLRAQVTELKRRINLGFHGLMGDIE